MKRSDCGLLRSNRSVGIGNRLGVSRTMLYRCCEAKRLRSPLFWGRRWFVPIFQLNTEQRWLPTPRIATVQARCGTNA